MYKNVIAITAATSQTDPFIERLAIWGSLTLLNADKHSRSYITTMARFENIARANILIVLDGRLTEFSVNEILYAILLKKPIITNAVNLTGAQYLSKEVISKRLGKMFLGNFSQLSDEDLGSFLADISSTSQTVNYVLTHHETILIRAQLRSFFRKLK